MVESIVGCKWSMHILGLLAEGIHRPGQLYRASPGISHKVLYERLHKLERFGIISRSVYGTKPPLRVEYRLTDFGQRFLGVVREVRALQAMLDGQADGR